MLDPIKTLRFLTRVADRADQSDLVAFKLPLDIPDYAYSIIWHRRSDGDPLMVWLRNLVAVWADGLPNL